MILKIAIAIIGILLIIVGIFGVRIFQLSRVTTGRKISSASPSKRALLVLDVQNDTLGIKGYGNTDFLMDNINSAIIYAQKNNIDLLYIKQEFSNPIDQLLSGGLYKKNANGSQLSSQLEVLSSNVFTKEKTDAFSNSELEAYLQTEKITTLYIVGADASACIYKTSLAAKNRGYEVIILKDSIFSASDKLLNTAIENYTKNDIKTSVLSDFMTQKDE